MVTLIKRLNCFIIIVTAIVIGLSTESQSGKVPRQCGRRLTDPVKSRVIGGQISQRGNYPWTAAIFTYPFYTDVPLLPKCGGSILTEEYILTAGHCCSSILPNESVIVRVGEYDILKTWECKYTGVCATNPQEIPVVNWVYKESEGLYVDMCVMRLETPIIFDGPYAVAPICLPSGDILTRDKTGLKTHVAGWGTTVFAGLGHPQLLLEVELRVMSYAECAALLREELLPDYNTQFCALGDYQNTCVGDSGTALVYTEDGETFSIVGITSAVITDVGPLCSNNLPSKYTDVTKNVNLAWIKAVISP